MSTPVVLYVEDEDSDVLLLRLACEHAGVDLDLRNVTDGEQAMNYLAGKLPFEDRAEHPLPDLILLDLNLPRENGLDVLAWLRKQPELSAIPVIVYTSSLDAADCAKARRLGADDYVVKLSNIEEIANFARELDRRWLNKPNCPRA